MMVLMHFLRRLRRTVQTRLEVKVLGLLAIVIVFASFGFYATERVHDPDLSVFDGLWWALVTMTTVGYGDYSPTTAVGRFLIAIPVMVAGGGVLAYALSVVTTYMIEVKNTELRGMKPLEVEDHILLVNYPGDAKIVEMLEELRADKTVATREVVLLTDQIAELPANLARLQVQFVRGSPINDEALQRANIRRASDAIVFSQSERDENSDSFNLGVLVALHAANDQIRTVVECVSAVHKPLMYKAGAAAAVCVTELSTHLLAQARQGDEIQSLFSDLASNRTPQQVDSVPFEHDDVQTLPFSELARHLADREILLIGVTRDGQQHINPGSGFRIRSGDHLLVISSERPEIVRLPS